MIAELCPLCAKGALQPLRKVEGVPYLCCDACGTILAERAFLERTMAGEARTYNDDYWSSELSAARERGYGASLIRVAEVFLYARRPIRRFLDVSCGAGTLLDAAAELMPEIAGTFWGIEPFPPPLAFRAVHPNYRVGYLRDLEGLFDGGICIEVIEHLPPPVLRSMLAELAKLSAPDAMWYFNSAQPDFVERDDPGYLDPFNRGHIASYSLDGLRPVFTEAGFTIHALPGRDWAFLAEYGKHQPEVGSALMDRVWRMHPENRALLGSARFGHLMLAAGMEGARCYIEAATANWAVGELRRPGSIVDPGPDRERMLEARLTAVMSSTSWRVTGPLRRAMRLFRGDRGAPTVRAPAPSSSIRPGLETVAHFRSLAEWQAWSAQHAAEIGPDAVRRIVDETLRNGLDLPFFGHVPASEVRMTGSDPREGLAARGTNSRLRAVLQALSWHERAYDIWNCRLYLHEALTPFALLLRGRYSRLVGSEYAPDEAAAKALWPVVAVDITRSPFPDAAFDIVVTNEVLEHVPDLMAALSDTARILLPGGQLIATFPFNYGGEATEIRARLTPEGIDHLHPPEYHGNPVDPEGGSLVFQIPGWDILGMCREAGFAQARMVFIGSSGHGITGPDIAGTFVLLADR